MFPPLPPLLLKRVGNSGVLACALGYPAGLFSCLGSDPITESTRPGREELRDVTVVRGKDMCCGLTLAVEQLLISITRSSLA